MRIAANNLDAPLTHLEDAPISYALRGDGIGYIMIREMDVNVPFGGTSTPTIATAFAGALADLATAKALVIDLRYNPGGSDAISFGIAGHFVKAPLPVLTKTTRVGDGQSAPFEATLQPFDAAADTRPIVLMTSKLTGSAAEILTIAMRALPQVTTLGEATSGGLSDIMSFKLPNGMGLGLSNQTYLTMDGQSFEGVGVPPDVPVAMQTAPYLDGRDPVLQAAYRTGASIGGLRPRHQRQAGALPLPQPPHKARGAIFKNNVLR